MKPRSLVLKLRSLVLKLKSLTHQISNDPKVTPGGTPPWGTRFFHASARKVIRVLQKQNPLRGFGQMAGEEVQRRGVEGEVNLTP